MEEPVYHAPAQPVRIRCSAPEDVAPAAGVYQAAARSLYERIRAYDPLANERSRQRDLRDAIRALTDLSDREDGAVVVADVRGVLAGVGAVRIQDRHAHIAFLFVLPEFQEQGVGRQLLDRLNAITTDAGAKTLSLIASRDPRAWQRYLCPGLRPVSSVLSLRAQRPRAPATALDTGLVVERLGPGMPGDLDLIDVLDLFGPGIATSARCGVVAARR